MRIILPLAIFATVIVAGTLGYCLLQPEYTFLESLYMTVITVATVGYREIHPPSQETMVFTIVVVMAGLISGAVLLTLVASMLVEGEIRRIFGRRHLERKIQNLSNHIVICGYGLVGQNVASDLNDSGRDVVVIDPSAERTEMVEQAGLLYLRGDAQEEDTLRAAGVERASAVMAALPTDAENVFLALTACTVNPRVPIIARAQSPSSIGKLRRAGATRVICPTELGTSRMVDVILRPAVVDFVEMAQKGVELELDQMVLSADSTLAGKALSELELPRRVGAHVVAVRRADGETVYNPTSDLRPAPGDTLIFVGRRGASAAVQKLQAEEG
ncbi:MAG: potassium channel family protein [Planctomycetota bacterium]